jgi:hypothetical protein
MLTKKRRSHCLTPKLVAALHMPAAIARPMPEPAGDDGDVVLAGTYQLSGRVQQPALALARW